MKITKSIKEKGIEIAKNYGYWSKEVKEFNDNLLGKVSMNAYSKLQDKLRAV